MCDDATTQEDRYLACRHLKFRKGRPAESEPDIVVADLCRAPTGVFALLDCPVWIGRTCRFFEEREGDPEPISDADLERLRERLLADYMRWPYRKRIQDLGRTPDAQDESVDEDDRVDLDVREIAARPDEVPDPDLRKARFPGDAPSGPPPGPVEVDLDNLPDIVPGAPEQSDEPEVPAAEADEFEIPLVPAAESDEPEKPEIPVASGDEPESPVRPEEGEIP
jgi:hypothetical protein